MNLNEHWDNIFENTNDEKLGWYEDDISKKSFRKIRVKTPKIQR